MDSKPHNCDPKDDDGVATEDERAPSATNSDTMVEKLQSCSACKNETSDIYRNFPCGCSVFCKKCAMKMATGGRCKVCKEFFTAMTSHV